MLGQETMNLLDIRNLQKAFGGTPVLRDIALDVREGEMVSLLGPSGCGKSTLLRIIAGLEEADAGEVILAQRDISRLAPGERHIAMVFQSLALYPHLSAAENIALPLRVRRLNRWQRLLTPLRRRCPARFMPEASGIEREIAARVNTLAEKLELHLHMNRRPAELSGGQQQRVAIARALSREARLLLLDEPLSSLDAQLRVQARNEIVRIQREFGLACVFVTHDQAEAFAISDRVAVMLGGRIAQFAAPAVLYRDPASLQVARFIGTPVINLVEGKLASGGHLQIGPWALETRLDAPAGQPITVGIRPEALRLSPAVNGQPALDVTRVENHGHDALIHLADAARGIELTARVAGNAWIRREGSARVELSPSDLLYFDARGARLLPEPLRIASLAHA
jgi:multiple sugar transport system ATP-binding protein